MEYQDYSAYPQPVDDAGAAFNHSADASPDPEYGQQQQGYSYGSAYDADANVYYGYADYGCAAEQLQADGGGDADGGYYDLDTDAYYYGDASALTGAVDDGEPLTELTAGAEGGYNYYEGNSDGYEGYEWDETTGQYTQAPSAFGDHDDGAEDAPPSPFKDEAYWEQELYNQTPEESNGAAPTDLVSLEGGGDSTSSTPAAVVDSIDISAESELTSRGTPKSSSSARSKASTPSSSKKKPKSKKERMQKRQELLEKEEKAKLQKQTDGDSPDASESSSGAAIAAAGDGHAKPNSTNSAPPRSQQKKLTFIEREKAKIHLQIRKARAIARKRMPFQVRLLTQTRQHLSPLEKYFGSRSVDAALSDIFWASLKGDLRRVRHLIEVENVSPVDCKLDPWNMQQTPLHWAAKGGSREVVEYLLQAGANVRCLDENGSFPLHIACWAGHIDATLALLKAGDSRDLYVQDFDAALAPLDWAAIRGHTPLLRAIEKFIEDLIRGIIRYKIKVFKPPIKPAKPALGKAEPAKTTDVAAAGGSSSGPAATAASSTDQAPATTTATSAAPSASPSNKDATPANKSPDKKATNSSK